MVVNKPMDTDRLKTAAGIKGSSDEIIECYEHNEGIMERLEGAH